MTLTFLPDPPGMPVPAVLATAGASVRIEPGAEPAALRLLAQALIERAERMEQR